MYSSFVLITKTVIQTMMMTNKLQTSRVLEDLGLGKIENISDGINLVLPDLICTITSIVCIRTLSGHKEGVSNTARRKNMTYGWRFILQTLLFGCLFLSFTSNLGILAIPYMVLFTCSLLYWPLFGFPEDRYKLWVVNSCMIYLVLHLLASYVFQFRVVQSSFSAVLASQLGLKSHSIGAYFTQLVDNLAKVCLFVLLSIYRNFLQRASELDQSPASSPKRSPQRAPASPSRRGLTQSPTSSPTPRSRQRPSSSPRRGTPGYYGASPMRRTPRPPMSSQRRGAPRTPLISPGRETSGPPMSSTRRGRLRSPVLSPRHDPGQHVSFTSRLASRLHLQTLVSQVFRRYGRILCHGGLLSSILMIPSGLSCGLLVYFCVTLILSTSTFLQIAPIGLVLLAVTTSLQYVCVVPDLVVGDHLVTLSGSASMDSSFLLLSISFLPLVFLAGYYGLNRLSDSRLTENNIVYAASTGDVRFIQRCEKRKPQMIGGIFSPGSMTLLHIAARHGQANVVAELVDHINVHAVDEQGNTALRIAIKYGFDEIEDILTSRGASVGAAERDELLHNRTWLVRITRSLTQWYRTVERLFLYYLPNLSLGVLYLMSMDKVDFIHLFYLLFFIMFFSLRKLAASLWMALVFYCAAVVCTLYWWSIYGPTTNTIWPREIGLFRAALLWQDLFLHFFTFIFVASQYHAFKKQRLLDQRHPSTYRPDVSAFKQLIALVLTYATLVVVAMTPTAVVPITASKLGYLGIFVISLFIHQYSGKRAKVVLARFWVVVVIYAAMVFFAHYAYQFDNIDEWVRHIYPKPSLLSLADLGLIRREAGRVSLFSRGSLLITLIGPSTVFIVCVLNLEVLWRGVWQDRIAARDGRPAISGQNVLCKVARLYMKQSVNVTALAAWIVIISASQISVGGMGYLVVITVMLPIKGGKFLWAPLSFYAAFLLLSR